jgi:hypothetical protein
MPIRFQYDAAAVVPPKQNELKKYGGPLIMQQRKYDMEQMQDRQQNDLRMGNVAAMQNFNREPSIGEDDAMLEQEIRSGAYDPETVRALRDDQRAMRQIMRDRNIDGTQRSKALDNLRSRMRMSRSTGKVQPMMQQMPPAAIQGKPPMTEAEFFSEPKNYNDWYATAQARLQEANKPVTQENIHAQMHNDYLAREGFIGSLRQPQGQPQPNAPAGPQAPTAPDGGSRGGRGVILEAGTPQASFSGGQSTFGASPVLAQGGFSQNGGQQYDPSMVQPIVDAMRTPAATSPAANRNGSATSFGIALAPGHPDYKAPPTPTNRIDERGYVIMSDGSKVDPRDDFAMSTGGRGQQAVMRLTHPDGSQIERRPDYMMPENYLASNAQGGIQQNSMRLVGEPGIPNLIAGLGGPSDYQPQFNAQGGMGASVGQGAYQPTGGYTSPQVFGAANVLANPANQQYAEVSGGNRDTQYALQNPQMSAGQAYLDPNNTVRQEMSAADQSMVNPQKQTLGKPGGRYGLGQIDYGINPATGNRVTASIRPGGTMPEYDEPIGPPGTAMGGGRGGLTIMGGRKKPAATPEVSPGGTPVDAGLPQARMDRSSPAVQDALKVVANSKATDEQKRAAAVTLDAAGYTEEELLDISKKTSPKAPSAEGSYRPSSGGMWGNPNNQPSSKKESPAWGSQKDVLEIPGQIYGDISAQVKETQKRVGKVMQDRDIDNRQRAKSLMTGLPPSKDQEIADSLRESIETQRKNPRMKYASPSATQSLLGELEQAEPSSATPAAASDSTQNQGDLRTWTSVDGRTFEGTIVEGSLEAASRQTAGQQMITVKRKDGQVFNIPIDRLGEEDRAYLDALYKTRSAVNWTEGKDSRMGKGEAYQQNKPAGNSNKKPTSKPKYIGETPKEVYQRPPSSFRGSAKRTS